MQRSLILIALIAAVFSSATVCAEEYPYIYKGIRPMGMGGAFVAVSDDANALFYNPAGLSFVPEKRLALLSIEAELSEGGYPAYTDIRKVDTEDPQEVADFLREYIGSYYHAGASTFPHYQKPHFAFGLFGAAKTNFLARDYQYPKLVVNSASDVGAAMGYAFFPSGDNLSVGGNIKYDVRKTLKKEYTLPEITTDDFRDRLKDDIQDGAGVLVDVGILYRFPEITNGTAKLRFQVGASVSNLVGSDMGDAEDLPEHVDLGFAVKSESWTFAFDYIDVFDSFEQDSDPGKRLRFGLEYIYSKLITLRGGFYEGYPTAGLSLGGKHAMLDLLTYAEEAGTYAGQLGDRRYVVSLVFGF